MSRILLFRPRLPGALFLIVLAGCARQESGPDGTWVAERHTEGNRTVVRTISGSVWGGTARLVEEASIGVTDGPDEYMLGDVESIFATTDRIFVADGQAITVRVYDFDGNWLFNVGRQGEGPGEFSQPRSVMVHPVTGDIFVRDGGRTRINRYSPDGTPIETWQLRVTFSTGLPMCVSHEGDLYTPIITNISAHSSDWIWGMVHCRPDGAVGDTLLVPSFDYEEAMVEVQHEEGGYSNTYVPFTPYEQWCMNPSRCMVGGVATDYRFEVHHPDGQIIVIERAEWDRIPVQPGERQWNRDYITASYRRYQPGWAWNGPEIPSHKPAYEDFIPDRSGKIWVIRPGPGIHLEDGVDHPEIYADFSRRPAWKETWFVDIFDEDGRFLGEVDLPGGFETYHQPFINGDTVVAEVEGEDGTPLVKRYRLVLPGNRY